MNRQTYQSEDTLAEVFDVEPIETTTIPANNYPVVESMSETDEDLNYVRANLYDLIEKGAGAVTNALAVANESQHPRAYEVAGNLIKNVADLTDKLVALQKSKVDLNPESAGPTTQVNVDKAVFIGSTSELLKAIKKNAAE